MTPKRVKDIHAWGELEELLKGLITEAQFAKLEQTVVKLLTLFNKVGPTKLEGKNLSITV